MPFCLLSLCSYKNNDTAQYNNNIAIIILSIFPCLLNTILNNEPNNAQHIEPVNPTNDNKKANAIKRGISL
jgi:hypothetical protein